MYDVSALGFGDNVVDKYEHIKTMYPGGNCVNFAVYAKCLAQKEVHIWDTSAMMLRQNMLCML